MYEYGHIVKPRAAYLGWSLDYYVHRLESGRNLYNFEIHVDLIRHASHNPIPIIFKYAIFIVQLDVNPQLKIGITLPILSIQPYLGT